MKKTNLLFSLYFCQGLPGGFLAVALPVMIREGGSIPIVSVFTSELKADVLLLGWGLSDDNTHSPNEKFSLADFHRGIRSSARLWQELANLGA